MTSDVSDVMHRKRGLRFEKSESWVPGSEEEGWLSWACRGLVSGAHVVWGRWKSQHRKVYLSPYVEKPLNSKVIKSFVPELRSDKCFCVSGFLCSMYICYEHSMYVLHIRIMGMLHHFICFVWLFLFICVCVCVCVCVYCFIEDVTFGSSPEKKFRRCSDFSSREKLFKNTYKYVFAYLFLSSGIKCYQ